MTESSAIINIFKSFERLKVLIVGDVMVDSYIFGHTNRISPEAPVPVVEVNETDMKLGLSGNVAANVASLGGIPMLFSIVGKDQNADHLKVLLKERNISADYLMEQAGEIAEAA